MTRDEVTELVIDLCEPCVDFSGEQIVDDSTPRYEISCGLLRRAATALAATQAGLDEARKQVSHFRQAYHNADDAYLATQAEVAKLREGLRLYQASVASCFTVGGRTNKDDGEVNAWWDEMIAAQQNGARLLNDTA